MTLTATERYDRVFESLDDLGARIYANYMDGNKADARMNFKKAPPDRRAYLAFTIMGLHMTQPGNPRPIEMEEFFKSITV